MAIIAVTDEQRHQHSFLTDTLPTGAYLTLLDEGWQRYDTPLDAATDAQLVMFAQSLTLHQVEGIVKALADVLSVTNIRRHPFCGQFGETVLTGQATVHNPQQVNSVLAEIADVYRVDVGVVRNAPSLQQPGLLVMDMDSTLIQMECIDEIASLAGVKDEVAAVTAKAMRGELDFNQSLNTRVGCLRGVEVSRLAQLRDSLPLMPGVQALLRELKMRGWKLAIASGGFTYFANHLKNRLGLDAAFSNVLGVTDEKLTGTVEGEIVNAQVKAQKVQALSIEFDIAPQQTIAMGDGANDLLMMEEAALGVACHAKPVVNQQADVAVRYTGLHGLLYYLNC
ncbi:phosphoserine phosphatase SerB [Salinimonas lutimaris]|uniref:phosphoserine phosphatase SerB n=1 Tax=Salinimonas lutimaris TaxID=914153 RepID=UPI001E34010B|nr:phosphoserine phosphatase SerB [Salinimonas lutimaris]